MSALSSKVPTTRGRMPCRAEPLLEREPQPGVPARQQEGRPVERAREAPAVGRRHALGPEDRHAALAEEVAVGPNLDGRRGRGVGEDEVERVRRQLGDETLRPLVHAVELDRLGKVKGRLEHLVGDQLGHDHGHPHRQACRSRDLALHGLLQLAAEREDLVRVAIDGAADVGEHHGASGANEQLLPESLLQLPELAADRGLRDVEDLARARHPAFADHRPEVVEVVMVDEVHAQTIHRGVPMGHLPNRYWTSSARVPYTLRPAAKGASVPCRRREIEDRRHVRRPRPHEAAPRRSAAPRAARDEPVRPGGARRDGAPGRVANPLGGVDQRCRMRARLQSGLVLRAEAVNGRIETAVGRSAARLALHVAAALDGA